MFCFLLSPLLFVNVSVFFPCYSGIVSIGSKNEWLGLFHHGFSAGLENYVYWQSCFLLFIRAGLGKLRFGRAEFLPSFTLYPWLHVHAACPPCSSILSPVYWAGAWKRWDTYLQVVTRRERQVWPQRGEKSFLHLGLFILRLKVYMSWLETNSLSIQSIIFVKSLLCWHGNFTSKSNENISLHIKIVQECQYKQQS